MAMSSTGFFRSAFERLVAAHEREADRYMINVLLSLDDRTLAEHGYSRAELKKRPRSAYYF